MKISISYYSRARYSPNRIVMYFPKECYKLIELREIISILRNEVPLFSGIDLDEHTVGVSSKVKGLDYLMQDGDHIEIYQKIYMDKRTEIHTI